MAQLKPISRRTLGEQVASQIMSMISTGTFNVGDKLPPEVELCRTLNVGRSTLREGLKALSFIGMVRCAPEMARSSLMAPRISWIAPSVMGCSEVRGTSVIFLKPVSCWKPSLRHFAQDTLLTRS